MSSTLRLFTLGRLPMEPSTAWYLNDLGEFRGKQELYTRQSPQRLKALRESALIESAVSSNRIEGVNIDPQRVRNLLREQQDAGVVTCAGRGAGALWSKTTGHGGNTLPPNQGNEEGNKT